MANRLTITISGILLAAMFLMAVFSIKNDSLTMDELAHLPAGYSYLTQQDMRINPEHPPLAKDLAAFPLLFINGINFPHNISAWQTEKNDQWIFGNLFLFQSNNPVDKMIFWGRIPMILLTIFLGFFIFKWARELFGNKAALLALFFYTFSPTFLAHGRLVTTDIAAATGTVLALYYFLRFLKAPDYKNIIFAAFFFAIAQSFKFSMILLYPLFGVVFIFWIIFKVEKNWLKNFFVLGLKSALIFILALLFIWPVYFFHTLNMPTEKIKSYAYEFQKSHPLNQIIEKAPIKINGIKSTSDIVSKMAQNPLTKPWSYYALGVFMATERAAGGNTTYFMGEVSASGWATYFPIVYVLKEPLAFHILTIIALLFATYSIKRPFWQKPIFRLKNWIQDHFTETAFFFWLLIYWGTSMSSNLNIGVRHLLPIFPFTYILVAGVIVYFLEAGKSARAHLIKYSLVGVLILWQVVSVFKISPYFLSYGNEIAGGPNNLYKYTVDSNFDWGQNLKRLKNWAEENNIDKIYVDYFGGADVGYYLKEKYVPWQGGNKPEMLPKGSYLAVSATFLKNGQGKPVPGFSDPSGYYLWLDGHEPIKKIGYSLFVYKID